MKHGLSMKISSNRFPSVMRYTSENQWFLKSQKFEIWPGVADDGCGIVNLDNLTRFHKKLFLFDGFKKFYLGRKPCPFFWDSTVVRITSKRSTKKMNTSVCFVFFLLMWWRVLFFNLAWNLLRAERKKLSKIVRERELEFFKVSIFQQHIRAIIYFNCFWFWSIQVLIDGKKLTIFRKSTNKMKNATFAW